MSDNGLSRSKIDSIQVCCALFLLHLVVMFVLLVFWQSVSRSSSLSSLPCQFVIVVIVKVKVVGMAVISAAKIVAAMAFMRRRVDVRLVSPKSVVISVYRLSERRQM